MGRGVVGIEPAKRKIVGTLSRIARIRSLLTALGQDDERLPLRERCAEALVNSQEFDDEPETHARRVELESAMRALDRVVRATFLGP